ncbi:MAG: AsnC family transcriptional regulator [Candidatus Hodarchaeota archaeon]
MVKIDLKDRKILYNLDVNSRESLANIAKKVGLSENSVAYRIKRLEKKGIIKNYYTIIDAFKLGYINLRFYLSYQYTTPDIEKEIINHFIKNKNVMAVYSISGRFDLELVMVIQNINSFYDFWQKTLNKYCNNFQDLALTFYIQLICFKPSYLINDVVKFDKDNFESIGDRNIVKIDNLDFQILRLIDTNARLPSTELAKKLNTTATKVSYRIRKLKKLNVIKGFRVNIDISKLGYQYFKVDIYLKDYKQRKKIINEIKSNPHLMSIDITTGLSHLELEFHLKDVTQLHKIMRDIQINHPEAIRNYRHLNIKEIHKLRFLPEDKEPMYFYL